MRQRIWSERMDSSSITSELAGTKGNDTVYLNNVGQILDTIDSEPSVRGNDVYLTIDHDLQVAVYHIVEQRLADVLVGKLTIEDFEADDSTLASEFQISVKDVYYQMFNNNILDEKHFSDDGASEAEKQILSLYEESPHLLFVIFWRNGTGCNDTV